MKRLLIPFSIISLLSFVFFTYLVKKDKFLTADFDIAVKLKDHIPPRFDQFFASAGDFGSVWVISLVLLIVIWKMPMINKLITVALYFAGQGLEYFLKLRLRQPGPPFQFQRHFTQTYFDKDYVQQGYSYPSGHSFRAIFIAILVIYFAIRKFGISLKSAVISLIAITGACLIMLGKIVLGAHWVTDIAGGALLAISLVSVAIFFLPSSGRPGQTPARARRNTQPQQ